MTTYLDDHYQFALHIKTGNLNRFVFRREGTYPPTSFPPASSSSQTAEWPWQGLATKIVTRFCHLNLLSTLWPSVDSCTSFNNHQTINLSMLLPTVLVSRCKYVDALTCALLMPIYKHPHRCKSQVYKHAS